MKKIIYIMLAAMMICGTASAQTLEHSKLFNNTYFGIEAGMIHPSSTPEGSTMWNAMTPTAGVEFGKAITPSFGLSLEGFGTFDFENKDITATNVFVNGKLNLMNFLDKYAGEPRVFEINIVPGIGWTHVFNDEIDPNRLTYKTGLQFDFNLGKAKAWQISLRPTILWNHCDTPDFGFYWKDATPQMTAGIVYKFGYHNDENEYTHNFTVSPYTVKQEDYDNLAELYNSCQNRPNDIDTIYVETLKEITVEKIVETPSNLVLFDLGESKIGTTQAAAIDNFLNNIGKDQMIHIYGSADSETGTESYNIELAEDRANNVVKYCMDKGYNAIGEFAIDGNGTGAIARSAKLTVK